jgi:hypothetical protein
MFVQEEQQFDENQSSSIDQLMIKRYKNLLVPAIYELSTKVQNKFIRNSSGLGQANFVILNLENEALDHIEQLVLRVFGYILMDSNSYCSLDSAQSSVSPH